MSKSQIVVSEENRSKWGERRWAQLINSLSGFKSANLIGTYSDVAGENLSVVSSVFHLGAFPALIGFVLRPHSDKSPRHTLLNLQEIGEYSINAVGIDFYRQAHQTSARYSVEDSEFSAVGLEAEYHVGFSAPFVKASPLQMQMRLREIKPVELNGTSIVIGQIEKIFTDLEALCADGHLDVEALGVATVTGLDSYHRTERLERLEYAKPDLPVRTKKD